MLARIVPCLGGRLRGGGHALRLRSGIREMMAVAWALLGVHASASASGDSSSAAIQTSRSGAAGAPPFHVARSTRWPCLQFGLPCAPVGSNAFAGALIMCNDTAVDKEGRPCCSASSYADPLDRLCYTTPTEVRDALSVVPSGNKLIGVVDGESDMGGPTLTYPEFWDPIDGGRYRGPWADNMTAFVSARWERWMAEYKKVGGSVDVLHVDAEWEGW